ncbi:MAG: hypothetical protein WCT99_10475 [Bacteroidota bacterium]|jgi:hypothetical protein
MNNSSVNIQAIETVADALGEINSDAVYVGGAVIGIYVNDPGAGDVRPTKDIDIVLKIATEGELERLRQILTVKGFTQAADDDVVCRFRYKNILVDVMSTQAVGWAPANPWFGAGFRLAKRVTVMQKEIRILPLAYFLATKFSSYHERGGGDPRTSHDIEDIVYILDNRRDTVEQITSSPEEVRDYLKEEFRMILRSDLFREAVRSHLFYETQKERFDIIIEKLENIVR